MPKHWNWMLVRKRQEWFKLASSRSVSYSCRYYGISRKTYYKWYKRYLASGKKIQSLHDQTRRPKTSPKIASQEVVDLVIHIRKQTNFGPRRIQFYLFKDYSIKISVWGVYKILKRAGLIIKHSRSKKRYQAYGQYIRYPGHKVQVDVKFVPRNARLGWKQAYQYSAKDLYTKLRFLKIYEEKTASNTVDFIKRTLQFFPFPIKRIQTDHGVEFTYTFLPGTRAHPLDKLCRREKIQHVLSPVATPRYNGQVERSHRTDMEEFYRKLDTKDPKERAYKLLRYLRYYNEKRPHMSLGMLSPFEMLKKFNKEVSCLNYECYL